MRLPSTFYQMQEIIVKRFPCLRPAQQYALALWLYGTILAGSACQNAVLTALWSVGQWDALRRTLREWLYDGADKAAPCSTQVEVQTCFPFLLRWLLSAWSGKQLVLGLDPTGHKDWLVVLTISVLYRGSAIPLAWMVLPTHQKGEWNSHWKRMLSQMRENVPDDVCVFVLCDRGLWSPDLYRHIARLGWHPLMRVQNNILFTPKGQNRVQARTLLSGPDQAWIGEGIAFGQPTKQVRATLVAVWLSGQKEPSLVLTNLRPRQVGVLWYGLRMWIEAGFRVLKSAGWQWQKTRRTDCERAARHWLVLAIATLWTLACGTRVEEARQAGKPPSHLVRADPVSLHSRRVSVFRQGAYALRRQLIAGYLWKRLWWKPQKPPLPPPTLNITYHQAPEIIRE
jgi:hypothetical protein